MVREVLSEEMNFMLKFKIFKGAQERELQAAGRASAEAPKWPVV